MQKLSGYSNNGIGLELDAGIFPQALPSALIVTLDGGPGYNLSLPGATLVLRGGASGILGIGGGARPLPPRLARELGRRECVEVVQVVEEAPAGRAGVRPGDLIVAVGGAPVESVDDLQRLMVNELIGRPVELTVARDDAVVDLELVPAELEA